MDILFVLLGVAIFFAAAAVFAIEHYEVNPAQALVSFFIPPFAWWLYSNYWKKSKRIVLAQFISVSLIIGGLAMMKLVTVDKVSFSNIVSKDSSRIKTSNIVDYVGSDEALKDLADAEQHSTTLNGRLNDKRFVFNSKTDVAEFDKAGILWIKHGQGFYGDAEIAIVFNKIPQQSDEPWSYTIRPETPDTPVIYLSWYDEASKSLKSLKYDRGYHLDFRLKHKQLNLFTADIQLVLPDPGNTFLVGDLPVYSSRLRFINDGINEGILKTFDSAETLEVIANLTLTQTYKKFVTKVFGYQETDFNFLSGDGTGSTVVYLQNDKGYLKRIPLVFYKNETGWFLDVKGLKEDIRSDEKIVTSIPQGLSQAIEVDSNNMGETKLAEEEEVEQVVAKVEAAAPVVAPKPESKVEGPSSIKIDVNTQAEEIEAALKPLLNSDIEIQTTDGKAVNGIYVGINRKQVVVEAQVAAGVVEYLTAYPKLKTIKVINASQVRPQYVEFYSTAPQ